MVALAIPSKPFAQPQNLRGLTWTSLASILSARLWTPTLRNRQDEALRSALGLGLLDAFTIGAESIAEQNDLMKRIAAA
jgi:hypothetical protein